MRADPSVALVTGAGKGIGRQAALAFGAAGWQVAANDLTPVNVDRTVERIRAAEGQARAWVADVAKKMPLQGMVGSVLEAYGGIDALACCASVRPRAHVLRMNEWDWDRTIAVNLGGAFLAIQSVGRVMAERGGGAILCLARPAWAPQGMAERAAYAAGKAGVIALTRAAAVELSPEGVRVNAICPDMEWRETNPRLAGPGLDLQSSKPEGQAAVGELIVRLCSADGAKWTGQVFDARGERLVF